MVSLGEAPKRYSTFSASAVKKIGRVATAVVLSVMDWRGTRCCCLCQVAVTAVCTYVSGGIVVGVSAPVPWYGSVLLHVFRVTAPAVVMCGCG